MDVVPGGAAYTGVGLDEGILGSDECKVGARDAGCGVFLLASATKSKVDSPLESLPTSCIILIQMADKQMESTVSE